MHFVESKMSTINLKNETICEMIGSITRRNIYQEETKKLIEDILDSTNFTTTSSTTTARHEINVLSNNRDTSVTNNIKPSNASVLSCASFALNIGLVLHGKIEKIESVWKKACSAAKSNNDDSHNIDNENDDTILLSSSPILPQSRLLSNSTLSNIFVCCNVV